MATTVEAPPSRARANAIGWGADPRTPVRRNRGRIAAAVVLMVVCGWLAAVVFLSVGDRREVVALARSVPRYQQLTEDDLRVVRVAADEGVSTLPAGRLDDLVGRVAATDLAPGTLLSEKQLLAEGQRAVGDGEAVVGTLLAPADSPDTLPRGARVQVIVRPATGSVDGTMETIRGWILDVASAEQAAGGGRKVSLVVPADSAETVAAGASEKRVSVVMLVALVSAKGSPGVTTTALALAAATSGRGSLLVESDPAGGDLECWCGPLGEPGLLGVATDLARDADAELIDSRAVEVVLGVRAVVAPTGESAATATIVPMAERLGPALATLDVPVLLDCGRWSVAHRAAGQVAAASLVGVVCRPTLDSVEHTRDLVESLRRVNRAVAAVVVGGHRPYGPDEVSAALGIPVAGVLPWEPRAVLALLESGVARPWSRSGLAGAATDVAAGLGSIAAEVWSHA